MMSMKIFIDADACPVTSLAIEIAKEYGIGCTLICDTSHVIARNDVEKIIVSKGNDSADFALVNRISKGDIAITQDYGLAAMCLAKGAYAINQNGMEYTDANIDMLLFSRHEAKKVRMAGGRLKGPKARTKAQDEEFEKAFIKLIEKAVL